MDVLPRDKEPAISYVDARNPIPRPAMPEARTSRLAARGRVLARACRPRQWSKNALVLAAPTAAGRIAWPSVALEVAGAFVVLCLVSSATYLLNDVRDRDQDRLHEVKRLRPVASGELSVPSALSAAAVLVLAGLGLAFTIAPGLAALAAGYILLTGSYSLWLRRVAILDMVAIAAGFVLRAFAGGVASDIYLSRWFVIVTACGAVFLVAAKRLAELRRQEAVASRASLRRYSTRGLVATLALVAALAAVAYVGWAFTRPAHVVWYACSIIPFLGWLARYARLIARGAGQAPEELILRDRVLLAFSAGWTVLFVGGVYAWS